MNSNSKREQLTQARLKELVIYDPETGYLLSKRDFTTLKIGQRIGTMHGNSRIASIDGRRISVNRLVWLFHHGKLPAGYVLAIDGDPLNSRIENLKIKASREKQANTRISKNVHRVRGGFMVRIGRRYIGFRKTQEDAIRLRDECLAGCASNA